MTNNLTFEFDNWIRDRYEDIPIWIATLSNNYKVYQDEERYPKSSFERLKEYCDENNLFIETLDLRFRSHIERIYSGEGDGLFLRRSIVGALLTTKNIHSYLVGIIKKDQIYIDKWQVPEIIKTDSEIRNLISDYEDSIIWKLKTTMVK